MLPFVRLNHGLVDLCNNSKVIKSNLYRAYLNAEEIILQAEKRADEIIKMAEVNYEQEKKRGYEEGKAASDREHCNRILSWTSESLKYIAEFERQSVQIVIDAIRNIINGYNDVELTMGVIRQALDAMRSEKVITLFVETEKVSEVKERLQIALKDYPNIEYIEVKPDENIARGCCRLETPVAVLSADIESHIEALRETMLNRLVSKLSKVQSQ